MSNIKVWAKNLWKIVGSGNATGISTNNASLLEEGEENISVYTALERLADWKDKSKAYIAWLAKNGGGGSGGSGGSSGGGSISANEATCTITVIGQDGTSITTGNTVILGNGGITIQLTGLEIKAPKPWTLTIRIGSSQVAIKTASYTQNTVILSQALLAQYLENHTGVLSINAVYEDDTNAVYGTSSWNGPIVENVVEITCEDTSTPIEGEVSNMSNKSLDFVYSVGYLGDSSKANYRLTVELYKEEEFKKSYSEDIIITNTKKATKSLALIPTLFDGVSDEYIGVYTIKTSLTAISNSAITSECVSLLTISSDNILAASTSMVKWDDSHVELGYYPKVSLAGSCSLDFTVYINSGSSYYYYVTIGDTEVVREAVGKVGVKTKQNISLTGKSWAIADTVNKIKLEIYTAQNKSGKSATVYYGIEFVKAASSLLSERSSKTSHIVSELIARNYNEGEASFIYTNDNYVNGGIITPITSVLSPINGNAISTINNDGAEAPYLRLCNGAAIKNSNWKYNGVDHTFRQLFPETGNAVKELTISCCFKADYHADDYRTILFCGTVNSDTFDIVSGISIDVHDIYINGKSVCKLSDNTINIVDVVIQQVEITKPKEGGGVETVTSYVAKIYVDGVMSAVETMNNFPFPMTRDIVDEIYLGCRISSTGDINYLCDCNIYNYKVYDTALSDYDIMINYINSKVTTEYYKNGTPGYEAIDKELQKNFCERDSNNNVTSLIYDSESDKYALSSLTMESTDGITFNKDIIEKVQSIGIPMMIIDVSADPKWTFAEFSNQQAYGSVTLDTSENRRIVYWDPSASNSTILEFTGDISLQGHSTLADFVKNLNITLPNETVFIPNKEWFPEKTYTLKADVVDSSHSNNAAIGQFINKELGPDENGDGAIMPFDSVAIDNVYKSDYKKNQQPSVTIKHTVTGFPVLLLMKFYVNATSTVDVTPLGIYSFNLGRDAYRNLGFKKVNSIQFGDKDIQKVESFPFLSTNATINETDSDADWIEIANTSTMDITNLTDGLPDDFDSSLGDFWQNDSNILNSRFEVRYPSNTLVSSRTKFINTFVPSIMELPIEGCATSNEIGQYSIPRIVDTYDIYKCDADGTNYTKKSTKCTMNSDPNHFNGEAMGFNSQSFYIYFDIAMLFGLADNFGKNTTYRSWNGGDYYIDFYDLDSGNGNSNQGELTIGTDMWLKYLYNKKDGIENYGYAAETFDAEKALQSSVESKVSANQNKLWLSLDTDVARSVLQDSHSGSSRYADYWADLMTSFTAKAAVAGYSYDENNPSNPVVDWFMKDYFEAQTKDCGPLLFNLDYKLKYLMQFTSDTYGNMSALPKLHGRKLAFTKDWLTKHIQFLDSVFNWRGGIVMNYRNNVNTTASNTVTTTRKDFPVTMNSPLLFRSNVGDSAKAFYFAPQNTKVYTNAGNNRGNSVLTWIISNSPNIISLGDDDIKLSDMSIQTIKTNNAQNRLNYEGLPAMTVLDLSNNKTFSSSFDLSAFTKGAISEIRELNFSNTKSIDGSKFNLNLTYNTTSGGEGAGTWFTKLTKINISNSTCINQVSIPRIPLKELLVTNSSITKFVLNKQAYLEDVNLSGCTSLTNVELSECSKYKKLSLSNLTQLVSVNITLCEQFEELELINCSSLTSVNIENCRSLKKITIKNCIKLTGERDSLRISGCSSLRELNLSGCSSLSTFYISQANQSNITMLNLASTSVTNITGDGASTTKLDLSAWSSLNDFNINSNSAVEKIQFTNSSTETIPLTHTFENCNNLKRIFGHVEVKVSNIFKNCRNFSIHGTELTAVKYNGNTVLNNGRVKMPWEFVDTNNPDAFTGVYFMSGSDVTNMDFGITNLSYDFYRTACTTFDIYYVLSNCPNATNISYAFYSLVSSPFNWSSDVDNSPNRYMFKWCNKLTSIAQVFYGNSGYIRLFAPTVSEEGIITDNGLFSPLVDTLTSCYYVFASYSVMSNRYLFRHSSKNYKISNLSGFSVYGMYSKSDSTGYTTVSAVTPSTISDYGDFTDFYKNLPSLTGTIASHMSGISYINFNTLSGVPATQLNHCFNSAYASGIIIPNNIFKSPKDVSRIDVSFRVNGSMYGIMASLPLTNDTFSNFVNLTELGYNDTGRDGIGSGNCLNSTSFNGDGIDKYINQEQFPYNIIPSSLKSKIKVFSGLFINCKQGSMTDIPVFPGALFEGCTSLQDVSATFYNIKFKYSLSGEGFKSSSNLKKVSYLFASGENVENYLTGQIPLKLFYHGQTSTSKVLKGVLYGEGNSVTSDPENASHWIIIKNGVTYHLNIINGIAQWTDVEGESVNPNTILNSKTISYDIMKNSITHMKGCFQGANTSAFECDPISEKNDRYMPFIATFANNKFTSQTVNVYENTGIWNWDGNYDSHEYPAEAENFDVPDTITVDSYEDSVSNESKGCTKSFFCAPDLLRYCNPTCDVTYLFAYSGHNVPSGSYGNEYSKNNYGIHGRIPPYLLYPLSSSSAVKIDYMFYNCKQLSYYIDNAVSYVIPQEFFTYCPNIATMEYTFSGMNFPKSISLNVFSAIPSNKLTSVAGAFYMPYFYGGSSSDKALVSNVFQTHTGLTNAYRCFAPTYDKSNQSVKRTTQYVKFSNIFHSSFAEGGLRSKKNNTKFSEVFAYYSSGYVEHENPKNLPDDSTTNNYTYYS